MMIACENKVNIVSGAKQYLYHGMHIPWIIVGEMLVLINMIKGIARDLDSC